MLDRSLFLSFVDGDEELLRGIAALFLNNRYTMENCRSQFPHFLKGSDIPSAPKLFAFENSLSTALQVWSVGIELAGTRPTS